MANALRNQRPRQAIIVARDRELRLRMLQSC